MALSLHTCAQAPICEKTPIVCRSLRAGLISPGTLDKNIHTDPLLTLLPNTCKKQIPLLYYTTIMSI